MRSARLLLCAALMGAAVPASAQDALDRGASFFLTGRLDSAIKFFSKTVKQYPKDSRAREILGHCLVIKGKDSLREGNNARGRAALGQAAEIFPDNRDLKLLRLLAELDDRAPTPAAVPISTASLDASSDIRAVLECFFGDGPCAKGGRYAVHIVRKGETMAEIAIKYYGDLKLWEKIWGANPHIANPHRLEKGMKLLIPLER